MAKSPLIPKASSWRVAERRIDLPPVHGPNLQGQSSQEGQTLCLPSFLACSHQFSGSKNAGVAANELWAVRKLIFSLKKKKKKPSKNNNSVKQEGQISACWVHMGYSVSPSVSRMGFLPSTTSPKSSRYKGGRPEIVLWGHKSPMEMSWSHGFRNIFCEVSRIWDNKIKVNSSFLRRLTLVSSQANERLKKILLCNSWSHIHLLRKLSCVSKSPDWKFPAKFRNTLRNLKWWDSGVF